MFAGDNGIKSRETTGRDLNSHKCYSLLEPRIPWILMRWTDLSSLAAGNFDFALKFLLNDNKWDSKFGKHFVVTWKHKSDLSYQASSASDRIKIPDNWIHTIRSNLYHRDMNEDAISFCQGFGASSHLRSIFMCTTKSLIKWFHLRKTFGIRPF